MDTKSHRKAVIHSVFLCVIFLLIISTVSAQTSATITVSGVVSAHTNNHKPVSSFIGVPTNGQAPMTVQFTDQSTYSPMSWKWEYKGKYGGWVKFSNQQNPAYTFQQTGTYDIRLTATNHAGSDTATKTDYITVSERQKKPEARFFMDPDFGRAPLKVTFREMSLYNPTSYFWKFGDGTTSSQKNPPVHVYTHAGVYRVQLTVSNSIGSDTADRYVVVVPLWWFNWGRR